MADSDPAPKIISRKAALALGLRYYFTNKPCKLGHVSLRVVSSAQCSQCSKDISKARYLAHRNAERQRMRKRYWDNRDRELQWARQYYANNRELLQERSRQWRLANPDKVRDGQRLDWIKNRERRLQAGKEWTKNNLEARRALKRKRAARKRGSTGTHTADDIAAILKAQRGRCAYCRDRLKKETRHVDHIMPLAKGGSNDKRNLQILCGPCNMRKHARDPIDHARTLGRLL